MDAKKYKFFIFRQQCHLFVVSARSGFEISNCKCTFPSGKLIVAITCPNVPFTCLKYIKPMQLIWKSEIRSRPSDKSCRYSTCLTVIFTRLRRLYEWNLEPCRCGADVRSRNVTQSHLFIHMSQFCLYFQFRKKNGRHFIRSRTSLNSGVSRDFRAVFEIAWWTGARDQQKQRRSSKTPVYAGPKDQQLVLFFFKFTLPK